MAMDTDANELRLYAAEIIRQLWMRGEAGQLELLAMQAKRSIESLSGSEETLPKES